MIKYKNLIKISKKYLTLLLGAFFMSKIERITPMADNRKYYYLKLKESYFDDDGIVLLDSNS